MDPTSRPCKTRKAWDEPGHAHFLTFSCLHRWPLLSTDRSRQWVIDALRKVREERTLEIWAYVIMPEHVHVVIDASPTYNDVRSVLATIKRPVAVAAKRFLTETGERTWLDRLTVTYPSRKVFRFWEPGGGFDRNIFREKTLLSMVEYIHNNPVRRNLVADPLDWEWSSAKAWAGHTDVRLTVDAPF